MMASKVFNAYIFQATYSCLYYKWPHYMVGNDHSLETGKGNGVNFESPDPECKEGEPEK